MHRHHTPHPLLLADSPNAGETQCQGSGEAIQRPHPATPPRGAADEGVAGTGAVPRAGRGLHLPSLLPGLGDRDSASLSPTPSLDVGEGHTSLTGLWVRQEDTGSAALPSARSLKLPQ